MDGNSILVSVGHWNEKNKFRIKEYEEISCFFDGDIATGSKYAVFDTFNVSDYAYEGAQTPKTMEFKGLKRSGTLAAETGGGDDPGTGGGGDDPGTGGGSDVPEPTSGILLMIGGAALALRRRR